MGSISIFGHLKTQSYVLAASKMFVRARLTCKELRLARDALVAGVGHEDIGQVVFTAIVVAQHRDLVLLNDISLVDGWSHRALWLGDLIVNNVEL